MATDAERSIDMMTKSLGMFADHFQKSEKASKGVATNVAQLATQLRGTPKTMAEVLGEVIKLPKPLRDLSHALITPHIEINKAIDARRDSLKAAQDILQDFKHQMMTSPIAASMVKTAYAQKKAYELAVADQAQLLKLEMTRLTVKEGIEKISGKEVGAEYLLIRGLIEAVRRSGEVNQALIQANSLSTARQTLTEDIYETQIATGASLQTMLGAAKALTTVWPKNRDDFKSTLEIVVQMEQGLGVSFEHSAELARTFQIGLKMPVREVADQIAIIANSTSLAADEATRFAIEIGKAIRLLGPGAAPGAREVTGYVTAMAARMKDVGGDASDIIKMFTEMQRGTAQGFMLRGLAGVTPAALGTQGGAQAAFQSIGRVINMMVSARPGTAAFAAQVEAASQALNMSTDSVVMYRRMLEEAKKPLDEHAKLQQRWSEQVTNANMSLHRIRESFIALVQRALLPIMPRISEILGAIADFISWLGKSKVALYATGAILIGITVKATMSLYRLSAALLSVAVNSELAARIQAARGIAGGVEGGGILGKILIQLPWLGRIHGVMVRILGFLGTIGRFLVSPPVLAVMIAGAVGYAVGSVINHFLPTQLKRAIGEGLYNIFNKQQYAQIGYAKSGQRNAWEIMGDVRRAALRGQMDEASRIFEEGKYKVAGLQTEKGAQAYLDMFRDTMAEVRERMALSTVTVKEKQTLENDQRMIELTEKQLSNSDEYLKNVRAFEQRQAARADAERARAEKQRMIDEAHFRMMPGNMPQKGSATPSPIPLGY